MIPMSKKYQEQKRMADSMNHFQDKFEEILEEKTDEIDEKIQAIDEIDDLDKAKPKVEEFKWGDIAMPDKF